VVPGQVMGPIKTEQVMDGGSSLGCAAAAAAAAADDDNDDDDDDDDNAYGPIHCSKHC